jgi:hypothetical protein
MEINWDGFWFRVAFMMLLIVGAWEGGMRIDSLSGGRFLPWFLALVGG